MSISPNSTVRPISRLLKTAVVGGVEVAVRLHIDRGDDLDSRDDRGSTPLMLAAARNKARICRLLIDAGADMLALDPSGRDALAIAKAAGALDSASTIEAALARKVAQASQVERSTQLGAPKNKGEGADCEDGCADAFRDDAWADSEAHSTTADSPAKPTGNRSAEPTNPAHPLASDNPSSAALSGLPPLLLALTWLGAVLPNFVPNDVGYWIFLAMIMLVLGALVLTAWAALRRRFKSAVTIMAGLYLTAGITTAALSLLGNR